MQNALPPGQTVVSVMGNHNVVQAGLLNSSATIILDREGKDKIGEALAALQKALESDNSLEPRLKAETGEMIETTKRELEAPKPNNSLLRAMLTGIASTVQTTASLQPAWQTLKSAMIYVGIL
jgi:hypothetical protein